MGYGILSGFSSVLGKSSSDVNIIAWNDGWLG